MIGSEGTLGVMTEITLRALSAAGSDVGRDLHLPVDRRGGATTIQIIQMGIPIARCELLDRYAVQAVNRHDKLSLHEAPMLLMSSTAREAGVAEQSAMVQEIASEHGGEGFSGRPRRRSARRLGGAASRLFRRPADEARLPDRDHRHLRADLAAGRVGGRPRPRKPRPRA